MNIGNEVLILNIEDILPNRFQPRIKFKEENINELAESIKEHGVIQPIVVRKISDKYEIIAGERRYKASILAGKTTIPAIITDLDDKNSAEVALIENVQRQNLTPIEEAISYKKILDMGYINQSDLANKLGKTQSTIANKLRLLNLEEEVQESLLNEKISERHARSLLKLPKKDQVTMLNRIISERMTVRKTDEEINKILNNDTETSEVKTISETATNPVQEIVQEKKDVQENPEIEILDFNLEKPQQSQQELEKTMEIPKINIEKEINNMNNNQLNIPSEPIIDNNGVQNNNQTVNLNNQANEFLNINNAMQQPAIDNNVAQTQISTNQEQVPVSPSFMQTESEEIKPSLQQVPTFDQNSNMNVQQSGQIEFPNTSNTDSQIPTGGKFFNMMGINAKAPQDLESSQANMNFEESNTSNPFNFNPIQQQETEQVPTNNNINFTPSTNEDPFENKLNPYSLNDEQQFTNINEIKNPTPMATIENTIVNTQPQSINQPVPNMPQEKFVTGNLRMVINTIRDCAATIEKYGFSIDIEELDFENIYQVIFKINKNS